jgi:hypothetical protein
MVKTRIRAPFRQFASEKLRYLNNISLRMVGLLVLTNFLSVLD